MTTGQGRDDGAGDSTHHDVTIEVDGVTVRFGGLEALKTVSLSVAAGSTCGIIGPNGAGKSTLLDVVSGLCRPASGIIRLDGQDVTKMPPDKRARRGLRRTFQRPQVFGRLTVLDNVLIAVDTSPYRGTEDLRDGPRWRRRTRTRRARARRARSLRERAERTAAALEMCGLGDLGDAFPTRLPIGARRMVELARAIAGDPSVLLLDEPASGLDAEQADRLAAVLTQVKATILLVEHDVEFVMRSCDRVVVLAAGSVIADAAPARILASPAVRAAYLG
jgi:branched-chain amino acid transport system ATP-binding protein